MTYTVSSYPHTILQCTIPLSRVQIDRFHLKRCLAFLRTPKTLHKCFALNEELMPQ